ncbi:hypothetical protein AVEN_269504-1 [Araneus ventricosus]|uniref:Uncharacterized protein n=1 Tax=Araneus ventricosus TaxID=182803 RepID=A0A4Y2TUY3_ARAVE|nr:hypothetical protein AVEN_269504-1 [Araneus ventricosus]
MDSKCRSFGILNPQYILCSSTTVYIVSRNRIRPEMLTGGHIWVQEPFDDKPICLPLAEVELKGNFFQLKTKAAVVCCQVYKGRYLLGRPHGSLARKRYKMSHIS